MSSMSLNTQVSGESVSDKQCGICSDFVWLLTFHGLARSPCVLQGPRTQMEVGAVLTLLHIPSPSWAECAGQKKRWNKSNNCKQLSCWWSKQVLFCITFIAESLFLSLFLWTWTCCCSEVFVLRGGLVDSGLSDSGDRGDNGLLLSKYSSKYLQVHAPTCVHWHKHT